MHEQYWLHSYGSSWTRIFHMWHIRVRPKMHITLPQIIGLFMCITTERRTKVFFFTLVCSSTTRTQSAVTRSCIRFFLTVPTWKETLRQATTMIRLSFCQTRAADATLNSNEQFTKWFSRIRPRLSFKNICQELKTNGQENLPLSSYEKPRRKLEFLLIQLLLWILRTKSIINLQVKWGFDFLSFRNLHPCDLLTTLQSERTSQLQSYLDWKTNASIPYFIAVVFPDLRSNTLRNVPFWTSQTKASLQLIHSTKISYWTQTKKMNYKIWKTVYKYICSE